MLCQATINGDLELHNRTADFGTARAGVLSFTENMFATAGSIFAGGNKRHFALGFKQDMLSLGV